MKSLQYFLGPLKVRHWNEGTKRLPARAYAVDKPCGKDRIILKSQFDMDQFHCCDYIIAKKGEDKVLLIEDSNLKKAKEDLEKECLRFIQDKKNEETLSEKITKKITEKIRDEHRMKAYASLLLLCRLISKDSDAKKLIEDKEIHFWIIVIDGVESDIQAFNEVGFILKRCLFPLVSNVAFLPLKQAEQKLSEWA